MEICSRCKKKAVIEDSEDNSMGEGEIIREVCLSCGWVITTSYDYIEDSDLTDLRKDFETDYEEVLREK